MARKSASSRRLEVGRLDESFQTLKAETGFSRQAPPRGWIRAMREALGMSAVQLAKRLGVSRGALYKLEEREASRSIALKQLDRAANAMNCDVFYAIVPRDTLEQSIRNQARKKAEMQLYKANVSMGLEAEGVKDKRFATAVGTSSSYTAALTDRYLWDD